MALFGNEEKKQAKLEKQVEKEYKVLEKYGVESLHNPHDIASVRKIANEMMGSGLMETGLKLTKPEAALPISLQRTLVEQNFIIIRQLDELISILKNEK